MELDFSIFTTKMVAVLGKAYGWTLIITFCALAIGIILGTLLALCKIIPQTNPVAKILNRIADLYILIVRGTPLLVQLTIIGSIIFANVILINRHLSGYIIAIIGFGLNSAAYVAEIIRTGILSVDKGQMEAGRSLGLTYGSTMKNVVLPQACKNIIPPLGNEAITLVKETSIALVVGVSEFFAEIKGMVVNSYNVVTPYLVAALVYLVTVYIMTICLKLLERRMRKGDRRL